MVKSEEANMYEQLDKMVEQNDEDDFLQFCPEDCGKKTFCHKGEPLPYNKKECYTYGIPCPKCGLPKWYVDDYGNCERIPHPKSTEQYWKDKVCVCP
jgi:hypothetical protein